MRKSIDNLYQAMSVRSQTDSKRLAVEITERIERVGHVVLKAIGAGAVNQCVKGIAIAEKSTWETFNTEIAFDDMIVGNKQVSGIKFELIKK